MYMNIVCEMRVPVCYGPMKPNCSIRIGNDIGTTIYRYDHGFVRAWFTIKVWIDQNKDVTLKKKPRSKK